MKNYKNYLKESVVLDDDINDLIWSATLTIDTDDLDEACYEIQTLIGQSDGGGAGMEFSDLANDEEHAKETDEEWWGSLDIKTKIKRMFKWVESEMSEFDLDYSYTDKDRYSGSNYVNGVIIYWILNYFKENGNTTLTDKQKHELISIREDAKITDAEVKKKSKVQDFNL